MKKEVDKGKTTYETTINKKELQQVIDDLIKSYPVNKKVKIVVV